MSPDDQRIAIAEACGWKWISPVLQPTEARKHGGLLNPSKRFIICSWNDKASMSSPDVLRELPDYLNDLNAMADAERACLVEMRNGHKWRDRRNDYSEYLYHFCAPRNSGLENEWALPYFAPAHLRAKALLRTLGLWTESSASTPSCGDNSATQNNL